MKPSGIAANARRFAARKSGSKPTHRQPRPENGKAGAANRMAFVSGSLTPAFVAALHRAANASARDTAQVRPRSKELMDDVRG
jgi:hypothetical protein